MSIQRKRILPTVVLLTALAVTCAVFVLIYPKAGARDLRDSSKNLETAEKEAILKFPKVVGRAAQSEARRRPSQMVNVTLYEQGIYPQKIRVRPGRIIFSIDDKYGEATGLIINAAGRQERIETVAGRLRGKGVVELGVGRYEIADASRPENRAILIVEP